jgi:murein DD-endopeptidase MepM/ murein hydrolase activator NlpD
VKPGQFPRTHLYLVGLLSLGLCSFVVAKFNEEPNARFSTESALDTIVAEPLALHSNPEQSAAQVLAGLPEPLAETLTETLAPQLRNETIKVKRGDNLANIFKKQDIPARELARLLKSKPLGPRLKSIFPGHTLTFSFSDDNTLMRLAYTPGPLEKLEFERIGDAYNGKEVTREPERVLAYKHGAIDHSLFIASQRAGLNDSVTMRLAQIYQWDIDFVLDIRKGDEFYVVYEELYLGEEFVGYGDIVAAEFVNQGDSYQAVNYTDSKNDSGFYNPNGESMRKAFLRAPVEFSRISSNFNLRRKHPLYKRTMPHRGIDYAAPSGTPILAAGDGRVKVAGRSKTNGNYVIINHGEQYVTKYLHLSKFANKMRKGSKVKQGQVIGYVGSTGLATGPHLHYEFLVSGIHKNPRTAKLPDAAPVAKAELARFEGDATQKLSLLESYKQQVQVAFAR